MSNDLSLNEFYGDHSQNSTGSPERNLLMSVLERAILDYTGNDPELSGDARSWLFDNNIEEQETEEFSFPWLCQQLDLNVAKVLTKIKLMPRRGNSHVAPWYMPKVATH